MNHFMLPEPTRASATAGPSTVGRAARYGNDAMEQLINAHPQGRWPTRATCEVKIFGGGRVLAQMTDVGQRNIDFVQRYIATENLTARGVRPGRRLSAPGAVLSRQRQGARAPAARAMTMSRWSRARTQYLKRLANDPIKGEVELF